MNFDDYQKSLNDFAVYPDKGKRTEAALAYCALGLCGESGEYAEKIKKYLRDDTFDPLACAKELGDVLWYLTRSAYELGFDLKDIAEINIEKLSSRKERGVLKGSGDDR